MKKYIKVIGMLMLLISSTSCEKYLEEEPSGFLNEDNFFQNDQHIALAMNGMYDQLMDWNAWKQPSWISILREGEESVYVDAWQTGSQGGEWYIHRMWTSGYDVIGNANVLIDVLENSPSENISEDIKTQGLGEAYFLRGWAYLDITRRYGAAPIRLEPFDFSKDSFGNIERSPVEEVLQQAANDFEKAGDLLSTIAETAGRPTPGAAYGLGAKAYMHLAGAEVDGNEASYNQSALTLATKAKTIADANGHGLEANYMTVFNLATQYDNIETLYTIGTEIQDDKGLELARYTSPDSPDFAGPNSFGVFSLAEPFYETFEMGDKRVELGTAIHDTWVDKNGNTVYQEKNIPMEYSTEVNDGTWLHNGRKNRRGFLTYENATGDQVMVSPRFFSKKYTDEDALTKDTNRSMPPLFRYADILLMIAELENEINGPGAAAYEAINAVRSRAGLTDLAGLSAAEFKDAVWMERKHEFYLEFQYWFEAKRLGVWISEASAVGLDIPEFRKLHQIPADEINANSKINANNPGY